MPVPFRLLAVVLVPALLVTSTADAQLDRLRRTAQRAVERELDRKIEGAVKCAMGNTKCVDDAKKAGKPVVITDSKGEVITDEKGQPVSDPAQAQARTAKPGEGVWRNYDFTPGRAVWVATDFTNEPVGRFPAKQLEFVSGNMQIVEREGAKVLEVSSTSVLRVPLPKQLEEDFTLEFYLKIPAPNFYTNVYFSPLETSVARFSSHYMSIYHSPGLYKNGSAVSQMQVRTIVDDMVPIKLQVDGDYAIMYVGTERVANVPVTTIERTKAIEFRINANDRFRAYLTDIVVAVGVDKMYESITSTGAYTTRGIFFDVDSDVLRPESTPVLEDAYTTLSEHADLSLVVEGHTDSTGTAEHNQQLSQRRAAAVVAYLTGRGIAASRLSSVGKGEGEPTEDNATPAGRAGNRRVVFKDAKKGG